VGDIVIATVLRIADYGAYVKLDEYADKEGLIHISEMSTRWVKNIRDHVKERQKIVLKVLRVNPKKGQIDLSLRRVTTPERNQKALQRKRDKKAETILNIAAEKLKASDSEINKIREKIIDEYDSLIDAFENSVESGEKIFSKINIPEKWIKVLLQESKARIKPEKVKVNTIIELMSLNPNGIKEVKNALLSVNKIKKKRDVILETYTIGAPKYRVEVTAKNYSDAENILKKAEEEIIETITKFGGSGRKLD
jgi:translation initiation factor 2 subunit 1